MERSSLPIGSAGKPDQFAVNQNQFLNRLPNERPNERPNRFSNQFPVLNLTAAMMTGEQTGFCNDCNNNHVDSDLNGKTIGDLNGALNGDSKVDSNGKNNPNDKNAFQTVKRRREFGNRGYIKKMRKVPFLGIFCAIMYAFFMSTSVALLKIVPNLHPIAVLVYRCIIQGGVFLLISIYNQKSLFGVKGERYPVAGRAVSGMMNQFCWYLSIKYISITDSSAIYYSAPAFVTVLAFFMLGERFGIYECSSVIITLIGVTLVSKPGFLPFFSTDAAGDAQLAKKLNDSVFLKPIDLSHNLTTNASLTSHLPHLTIPGDYITGAENYHVIGMSLAFIGAITFALSNIYVRQMKKTPTEVTAFWFGFVTILVCAPMMWTMNAMTMPGNLLEWSVVVVIGVFAVLGQIAFTLALKIEKAGPVSVAQTLNIVIVLFYQIVFFHEPVTITSLVGVLFIILSVMIIGFKDLLADTQLIKQTVKKLSKSSNGQFKLDNSLATSQPEKHSDDFSTSAAVNYGIKVLPSSQFVGRPVPTTYRSVCIAGNCKNNVCFNLSEFKEQQEQQMRRNNMFLNLQSYHGPPKYIIYNKNDIY